MSRDAFVEKWIAILPRSGSTVETFKNEWADEEKFPWILLFAEIAMDLVHELNESPSSASIVPGFDHVESGMNASGDLVTAVATGLLEGIVSAIDNKHIDVALSNPTSANNPELTSIHGMRYTAYVRSTSTHIDIDSRHSQLARRAAIGSTACGQRQAAPGHQAMPLLLKCARRSAFTVSGRSRCRKCPASGSSWTSTPAG